ncbi:MAG: endonuclease [Acidithiobacillus sp.]|nr:endonuclease [Acidithiobacillus sp.]
MTVEFAADWAWLYQRLSECWGVQPWWPADSAFEVMVGAILTQNTAWTNVEKAIARLRAANLLTAPAILAAEAAVLEDCLRPAGYFRIKARRLLALVQFLVDQGCAEKPENLAKGLSAPVLRPRLLAVHGVGEETADSILLYALDLPVMVVDSYTRRIASRLGWVTPDISYAALQRAIDTQLPPRDVARRKELHALLVQLGKDYCRPRTPRCGSCPLNDRCAFAATKA